MSPLPMSERIEINPDICNGRPIICGTRISVETVLASIEYARRLSAARSTVLLAS